MGNTPKLRAPKTEQEAIAQRVPQTEGLGLGVAQATLLDSRTRQRQERIGALIAENKAMHRLIGLLLERAGGHIDLTPQQSLDLEDRAVTFEVDREDRHEGVRFIGKRVAG